MSKTQDLMKEGSGVVQNVYTNVLDFFSDIATGAAGILKAVGITPGNEFVSEVENLADQGTLTENEIAQMYDYVNEEEYEKAAEVVSSKSSKSLEELTIVSRALRVSTSMTQTGISLFDQEDSILDDPFPIGDNNKEWSGGDTDREIFTIISTVEELESEIHSIDRPVTEVVVHWTESYANANLTAGQIHDRMTKLGHDGIQYHYIIQRNGTLQRGKPVGKRASHAEGHDNYSIALAFVGGYNTDTTATDFEDNTGIKSLTRSQFNTFDEFLRVFFNKYPGGQVLGHNDIDRNFEDPGFDVIEYCYDKFKKCVKYTDTYTQNSFSPTELNNQ